MNVPAIAKKTYEELRNNSEYMAIISFVTQGLNQIKSTFQRVDLLHQIVDEFNRETFSHPLVKEMSPCKLGCSACCHTQVSVTDDEAELLADKIKNGLEINYDRLKIQFAAKNDGTAFFQMSYEDRKCIFLDDNGGCKVYADRPSVCRTNVVLGNADQCDTSQKIGPTRLVRTPKADMAIYAAFFIRKIKRHFAFYAG